MDAGQLDQRVTFQQPVLIRDPDGMLIQGWEDRFTLWCHVRYLRGSEAVMQARLVSRAPVILTVQAGAETRTITSRWRAVIGSVIFDLKEDPRSSEDGRFLEMLAEGYDVAAETTAADRPLGLPQPEYSRAVGGAARYPSTSTAPPSTSPWRTTMRWRWAADFLGFGFYPRSSFIHVDLEPARQWGERFPVRGRRTSRAETPPVREVLADSRTSGTRPRLRTARFAERLQMFARRTAFVLS